MHSSRVDDWLVVLMLLLAIVVQSADGCPICVTYPKKSVADYLIESSCVVFAREDPERPFAFAAVEVLKGTLDQEPIDLLVDSTTRRMLAAHPQRMVVLAQNGETKAWRPLGLADARYATVVRRILLFSPAWHTPEGRRSRAEFFVPLFGDENPVIYRLAYLELARAPYSMIQQLGRTVSRAQLDRVLLNDRLIEWRPLALLLLAQSDEPRDRQLIVELFHSAEQFSSTRNLAALATAYIELEAGNAVSFIKRHYFLNGDRQEAELDQIQRALSLQGTEGRHDLRDQIVASYAALLKHHPAMAERVAVDLLAWRRSELIEQLASIEATHSSLNPADQQAIRQYLRVASTDERTARRDD